MIRRIGIFLIGTTAGFLVMYLPMGFLIKEPPPEVIVLAAATSVVPGVIVFVAARRIRDKPPEVRIVGVLLATIFRMVGAIGVGFVLYQAAPAVREHVGPFVSWGIVFYVVTLLIETRLLYIDNSGSE